MFHAQHISYKEAAFFNKIILDYIEGDETLRHFYSLPPNVEGIQKAIRKKNEQPLNRTALVSSLSRQYATLAMEQKVQNNIDLLHFPGTYTICTAHQPNLFTGPLYFIYKILHAIKLADHLNTILPAYKFVPLYYMGSEDADLAELNHFTVRGKKYEWKTDQTGAVGRMVVDAKLILILNELYNQIGVEPHGTEFIQYLKEAYTIGEIIQTATFKLVHTLFGKMGLVVLIADTPELKQQMINVFEDDLFDETPSKIVEASCTQLSKLFKVQAQPRTINLFYLKDNIRERIERNEKGWTVLNTKILFTASELRKELNDHPERFSPNVILRGLYQETILPNIAFIGGGGELAYWLQLKDLFQHYHITYPVLVLRNSFLFLEGKQQQKLNKIGVDIKDLFSDAGEIIKKMVQNNSSLNLSLQEYKDQTRHLFYKLGCHAFEIDVTLEQHVDALKKAVLNKLNALEQKILRAEKNKLGNKKKQIIDLKSELFPDNDLQERVENISGLYARHGKLLINRIYEESPTLHQQFTILTFTSKF
jgi:bacillithiol biosynthesis cysteine-adding enzyme BshC